MKKKCNVSKQVTYRVVKKERKFTYLAFYPFSLVNFFDYTQIAPHWLYPLKSLNIFEVLYWPVLVLGIYFLSGKKLRISAYIVLSTYILFFFVLWRWWLSWLLPFGIAMISVDIKDDDETIESTPRSPPLMEHVGDVASVLRVLPLPLLWLLLLSLLVEVVVFLLIVKSLVRLLRFLWLRSSEVRWDCLGWLLGLCRLPWLSIRLAKWFMLMIYKEVLEDWV